MAKVIAYQKHLCESQCAESSEIQYHYWFRSLGQKKIMVEIWPNFTVFRNLRFYKA